MHYANGRVAQLGDLVKGRGYNAKHEIIGKVVNLRQGDSCNISVAHVSNFSRVYIAAQSDIKPADPTQPFADIVVEASIEYGSADGFVALDPNTGEVLKPQTDVAPSADVKPTPPNGVQAPAPEPVAEPVAESKPSEPVADPAPAPEPQPS